MTSYGAPCHRNRFTFSTSMTALDKLIKNTPVFIHTSGRKSPIRWARLRHPPPGACSATAAHINQEVTVVDHNSKPFHLHFKRCAQEVLSFLRIVREIPHALASLSKRPRHFHDKATATVAVSIQVEGGEMTSTDVSTTLLNSSLNTAK